MRPRPRSLLLAPILALALALSGAGPRAAGLPDCQLSLHPVSAAGEVREQPLVAPERVAEVVAAGTDPATGNGLWVVALDAVGAAALEAHTAASIGRALAVRCDGVIIAQPVIREAVSGEIVLVGDAPPGDGAQGVDDELADPDGIMAWVDLPRSAAPGEALTLTLTLLNTRADAPFRISSVDIGDAFLRGFRIVSLTPEPRHRDHSLGTLTLEFPLDLAPQAQWTLRLELEALGPGVFMGDVDVWEGDRFLTRAAQVQVR